MNTLRLFLLSLGLCAWTAPAFAAAPADLYLSEVIEGSSNNKALEIYNGTAAAIDLSAGGYNLQMFFNGNPTAGLTINLSGSVASGDVFVLAHASANPAILAVADQIGAGGWFNGDDALVLRRGTAILDVVGQVGADPGTEWGAGLVSTADNTIRRRPGVCAGDVDPTDAFDPAGAWDGFVADTFDGLGSHTATCQTDQAPLVASTSPADAASGVALNANVVVTFSEPVALGGAWFSLVCTVSGPHTAAVAGDGQSFTVDPASEFVGGETCSFTVHAAQVQDTDAQDPPDTMTADVTFSFTPVDACSQPVTLIPAIQGSGAAAAITGNVTTRGVVVGDYEGPSPALRGFYLQDPAGDGDPATSDGIFVFSGVDHGVQPGDLVTVTGTAAEFQDQTQISARSVVRCGSATVNPVDVTLPFPDATFAERYEGMLVRLPQTLVVTEHFQLGRFGQVVVSSGGRLQQPTNVVAPGAPAQALQQANNLNRIIIDDGTNGQNPDPILFARGGQPLSASNTLRGGDTATGTVGVMTYTWAGNAASGNAFRVRPVHALHGKVDFAAANPRPTSVPAVGGNVKVVGMNLLNFFNTFGNGCTGGLGGAPMECRGADNAAEFARQVSKTVAALLAIDADIMGVNEIENDGYGPGSAIDQLVDELNARAGAGTYAFIDVDAGTGQTNALGADAIKVGMLYKPAFVTPVGQTAALNSVAFVNGQDSGPRSRPSLAQAFQTNVNGQRFIVNVNHLKSKGSACDAPDAGDGQGNCNTVRTNAARELVAWLASDPTGTGDPDVLLIGDYNAYAMEDPITVLKNAGWTDLAATLIPGAYSYVFDGQWGYLDHALASRTLAPQVTGVAEYHINADEPSVLDYNTNFKTPGQLASLYAPDQFRVSDHDPVVVGICTPPTLKVNLSSTLLWPANHHYRYVQATFAHSADTVAVNLVSVTSNEPDNGDDDGNTVNDVVVVDNDSLRLRAERSGTGTGRVYTVTYRATNLCGGTTTATATVKVPRTLR
jgi:uncharacterized protein